LSLTNLQLEDFLKKLIYSNKSIARKHIPKQAAETICIYILKYIFGLYTAAVFIT